MNDEPLELAAVEGWGPEFVGEYATEADVEAEVRHWGAPVRTAAAVYLVGPAAGPFYDRRITLAADGTLTWERLQRPERKPW